MSPPKNVAILDDESEMRIALARLLRAHGFAVTLFGSGNEFLAADIHTFDSVLLDLQMPGVSGFEVLAELAARGGRPPVIVITGQDERGGADRARTLGAADYLLKPVERERLIAAIERTARTSQHGQTY